MHFNKIILALAAAGFASSAYATDGMNLEGYGPIATGMGGASMAYDNGVAAVMNNPATLGLMPQGNRLDVAVGFLGPDVTSTIPAGVMGPNAMPAPSGGDAYYMPAVGWAKHSGALTYGVGVFAQGGMGTEYDPYTFPDGFTGQGARSELGVGRLIAPLAYNVNDKFTVGGSLDFVWAMLDIKLAASADQVAAMTGGMDIGDFGADTAYLSFSDDNDFTGKAKGTGFAGKLGFTYKLSPTVTIGGTYHTETSLGDLKTSSSGAAFALYEIDGGEGAGLLMPADTGKITVVDFQWPSTYALGVAVQATPKLLVAADVKQINWSDVMKNFTMVYSSPMMGSVTMVMPQNWDDQTVLKLGVSYKATDALTLRVGASFTDNPIPDSTVNPLFPAIIENHYTVGVGYAFNPASELNFSLTYAPEVTQNFPGNPITPPYVIEHSQTSWQLMYSHKF